MSDSYIQGGMNAPPTPQTNMDEYHRGRADAERRRRHAEETAAAEAIVRQRSRPPDVVWSPRGDPDNYRTQSPGTSDSDTVGDYFGALVLLPVAVGLTAALIALIAGGDVVGVSLISGGIALALVVAYGVIWLTVRLLPLLILVLIVLYVLGRFDVGPGFPP